jgi:phosphate-selective porin
VKSRLARLAPVALALALAAPAARGQAVTLPDTSSSEDLAARVQDLAGQLEGMTEQVQTLLADTDKLKKFKFSGYLQGRWETAQNKSDTVKVEKSPAVLTPVNNERFYIRRARLKLTYDSSPLSQAVLYFDGGQDRTLRLLEAYVTLLDPWTPYHTHALTVGQMNVPFGYEIERSSSVRELPERSRAENILFSGERDRGIKLVDQWTLKFETVVAIMNGGGINQPDFPNTDPTRGKDVMVRARYAQGTIDGAVSYYTGRNTTPLTGPDIQTDKTRLGLDAQFYYELPIVGGGSLKGEYFGGKNVNADSLKALVVEPTTANPVRLLKAGADPAHLATDFVGWYAMWVQNLGEKLQLAVRYDAFDPNQHLAHDQYARTNLGVNWFYDGFTRVTVAYDIPKTDKAVAGGGYSDPRDNLLTIQLQHKF